MPDLVITNVKAKYDWIFQRGASTATRTISIDDVPYSAEGVSKATAFRDIFTGAASSPFTAINPTKFWQPTGWRDEDLTEEEWTTVGCDLSIVKTDEWQIGGGSGGGGGRPRNFTYEINTQYMRMYFYYEGAEDLLPKVYTANGTEVEVDEIADENYRFEITISAGNTYFIFTPAQGQYAPLAETVTVPA